MGAQAVAYNDASTCFQGPIAARAEMVSGCGVVVQFAVAAACRGTAEGNGSNEGDDSEGGAIELRSSADFDLRVKSTGKWVLAVATAGKDAGAVVLTASNYSCNNPAVDRPVKSSAAPVYDRVRYLWSTAPCKYPKDDSAPGTCSVYNAKGAAGNGLPAPPFFLNVASGL